MIKLEEKIIILSTCKEITYISRKAIKKLGLSIKVEEVDGLNFKEVIYNLIEKAKEYKKNGAEIIITRVGGDQLLIPEVNIKTIGIEVTGYDILKCLYKYKGYDKPIAVVECQEVIKGVKMVGETLGLDIHSYRANHKNAYCKIDDAINDGIELIIGGSGVFRRFERNYSKKKDLIFEQIDPSENSVIEAIRKAYKLYEMILDERSKKEIHKTVLDLSTEGIISVDKKGYITTVNPVAEKILGFNKNYVTGKSINDIITGIKIESILDTGKIEMDKIEDVGDFKIVTNKVPILINNDIMGAVITFQKVTHIQGVEQKIRCRLANKGLVAKYTFENIKGKSDGIKKVIETAKKYSEMSSTVLIIGETGTGKEVFAQSIHNESNMRNGPFVAVNCSALPGNLLESELFGYAEGAFTGARKGGKQGIFELAHKGTIFLDEIGEIDKNMQARLLRVIQERQVMRIGDDKIIPIDVRIIAATNKDLYEEVENGNFREDLYFRLNVLNLDIPPLRERKEDIEELVSEFLERLNRRLKCKVIGIDNDILRLLKNYDWPGNIREFQNVLEKMIVITKTEMVKLKDVDFILKQPQRKKHETKEDDIYSCSLKEIEKRVIIKVLTEEKYNKTRTAKRLGIDRSTLFRKIEQYG